MTSDELQRSVAGLRAFRQLVLMVGNQLVVSILGPVGTGMLGQLGHPSAAAVWAGACNLTIVGSVVGSVLFGYRAVRGLQLGKPLPWAIALVVPCVNLIAVLNLSTLAQRWC